MEQEIKKWNIIYPVYINSKKTIAEGRRISASKACENPTCMEISDCCGHLKIPHAVEVNSTIIYFVLFFRFYYTSRCLVVVLATGLGFYREVGPICFKIRVLRFNICVRQLQFSCARCLFGMPYCALRFVQKRFEQSGFSTDAYKFILLLFFLSS